LLLLFGTLASSAAGRVFYQTALTATQNDNGYVTMFFLLTPVLTPLISLPLSRWLPDLQFLAGPLFFAGTALVAAPLFLFSLIAWRGGQLRPASSGQCGGRRLARQTFVAASHGRLNSGCCLHRHAPASLKL
jgi:hypothetical protein